MNPPNKSFFMMADSLFDSPDSLFSTLLSFEIYESAPILYESAIITNESAIIKNESGTKCHGVFMFYDGGFFFVFILAWCGFILFW